MIPIIDNPAIQALYPAPASAVEDAPAPVYVRAPLGAGGRCVRESDVQKASHLVTPPVGLPASLAAAVSKARADGADMEAEVELEVRGIAGQVEHEIGRALIEQTWAVTLTGFPASIKLPKAAPLIAIEHVKFYDVDGVLQTLDPQDYMAPKSGIPAHVMPAPGRRWPDTATRADAVEVQYRCGYGPDHAAVPAAIQSYILGRLELMHLPAGSKSGEYLSGLLDSQRVYG